MAVADAISILFNPTLRWSAAFQKREVRNRESSQGAFGRPAHEWRPDLAVVPLCHTDTVPGN